MELRHREYDEALKARWRRKIAVVLLFRHSGSFVGRNMMKEVVCHHIMPYHILSCRYWSDDFGKQRYSYACFFLGDAPKLLLQVARQATGQKKAAALKEDKAGLQCCDVFSKGTDTTPLFAVLLTSDLNFCENSKGSF